MFVFEWVCQWHQGYLRGIISFCKYRNIVNIFWNQFHQSHAAKKSKVELIICVSIFFFSLILLVDFRIINRLAQRGLDLSHYVNTLISPVSQHSLNEFYTSREND